MSVRKKGNKWYCRFQSDGISYERACKLATNQKEALKCEAIIKAEIMKGNYEFGKTVQKKKLSDAAELYLNYSKTNKKSFESDKYSTKLFLDFFENIPLEEITPAQIEKFKTKLKDEKKNKNATVNRHLHNLSKMFNLARENGLMKNENPMRAVRKLKEDNYKIRFLTKEEEKRLFEEIERGKEVIGRDKIKKTIFPYLYLKPIVICALQTGMRKSEILNLKWLNIDTKNGFIELLETKSGKARKIPISKKVQDVLNFATCQNQNDYVFINPQTKTRYIDIHKSFNEILQRAKVENFRFHDLRHTVATRLVESGIDLAVVQEIMGHANIQTTMRYAHPVPERKKKAIEALNNY